MKKFILIPVIIAAAAGFFSCATPKPEAPEWVASPPADTSEYTYFLGVGSDTSGDEGAAAEEAQSLIISEITKYIGVRVVSATTSEARDAYGKFEAELVSVITETSQARLSGLKLKDRWVETSGDTVNVYLLAEYSTSGLAAEKNRLEELFREKQEVISGPEQDGDSFSEENKSYRAAVKYIEAALAASNSDLENADLKFERNMTKARNSVEQIDIKKVSGPDAVYVGEKFGEDFVVKLTAGGKPAEGLPVTVSYKELRENGRKTVRTYTLLTDSEGIAAFTPPAPGWVGTERVTFFLDMRAVLEPLENVSFNLLQYVDGLEQAVNMRRTFFDYDSISKAVEIPTCVMVMDVDRSGNPLNKTDTASGILSELSDSGFSVFMIPVDYRMTAVSDSELLAIVREQYGNIYARMIFGTAEISSFEENGSAVIVKVTGKIKAVDLASGKILFSSTEQKRAQGGNNPATISAAFTSLGRMYGEKLVSDLP